MQIYMANVGFALLSVTALGYLSNFLNWRFLNYRWVRALYYIGAFVHETSHAILCILTGAKIFEYKVFSFQPHVTHSKSKIPILGETLIAFAPIIGGLFFLYFLNRYTLGGVFAAPHLAGIRDILPGILAVLKNINILTWQSWVAILLSFNIGAMLGPSLADLKHIWFVIALLFFAHWPVIIDIALFADMLIMLGIALQLVLVVMTSVVRAVI